MPFPTSQLRGVHRDAETPSSATCLRASTVRDVVMTVVASALHRRSMALASGVTPAGWRQHCRRLEHMAPHRESAVPSRRRPLTAPDCDPATAEEVRALADFISRSERLLVITGAGVSTESSVPDYRSPRGSYSTGFKPMTHQDFMRADENRRRYWARSFVGWKRFAERTRPNPAHEALAALQREGHVWRLITQNVDRLHHAAGSENVLELHGTTHEVVCLACGDVSSRRRMQKTLERLNPDLIDAAEALASAPIRLPADESDDATSSIVSAAQRPDGDAEIDARRAATFEVPPCASCGGGPLKPKVVFFGDSVPAPVVADATAASEGADAVFVVGSSVSTFSAFRLVRDAAARGAPVAVLTAGETRADPLATLKVERLAGETLPRVLEAVRREQMWGY